MKKLEKIYATCELKIPNGEVEVGCNDETICTTFKLGKEKFFINWDSLANFPNQHNILDSDDSDQMENHFSNEKLLEEEVIYSSKIEGINLTSDELKKIKGEDKKLKLEYKDVHKKAFAYLLEQPEINHTVLEETKNILSSIKTFGNKMTEENSRYRNGYVGIYKNANGVDELIHKAIDHSEVESYLNNLFKYFNDFFAEKDEVRNNPVLISGMAAVTHCLFEYIHPYFDGNGRMGRMLLSWFLRKTKFPHTSYFLSEIIDNNKSKYYKSLEHSQKTKNLTYHSAFMFSALTESLEIYWKIQHVLSRITLTEIQARFLKKLLITGMNDGKVSYPLIKGKFKDKSKQSFFKMVDKLIEKGALKEERTSKIRYFYFEEIED